MDPYEMEKYLPEPELKFTNEEDYLLVYAVLCVIWWQSLEKSRPALHDQTCPGPRTNYQFNVCVCGNTPLSPATAS